MTHFEGRPLCSIVASILPFSECSSFHRPLGRRLDSMWSRASFMAGWRLALISVRAYMASRRSGL